MKKYLVAGGSGFIGSNLCLKLLNGNNKVIVKKKDNNEFKNFDNNKSLYSYQIEKISKNILNGNKKVEYPGMNFDETLLNMKIIDEWVNA